ncbi:MAG: hypothetical protein K8R46_04660, partial [Pirellulales bacterium]|nr:hypothetical protein [Pirellulales bacterium]
MSPSPDPPFESEPQGISLDELARAFSQVMEPEPRQSEETPPSDDGTGASPVLATPDQSQLSTGETPVPPGEEDSCPVNPRTILEAMLF